MELDIYKFTHYKTFLKELAHSQRGLLTLIAEAGGCQKSYLSSCLTGKNHLTLDHLSGISDFLKLSDSEEEYFFLLLEKEKAGTPELRFKLERKIKNLSREAARLKNTQNNSVIISTEENILFQIYYQNWIPVAVHLLTSTEKYNTALQISRRLSLPIDVIQNNLNLLEKHQFVSRKNQTYTWDSPNFHLSDNHPMISQHHTNWRIKTIENLQKMDAEALHYSLIQTISEKDFEALKKKIFSFIKEFSSVADPSAPEDCVCLNIDFFKI